MSVLLNGSSREFATTAWTGGQGGWQHGTASPRATTPSQFMFTSCAEKYKWPNSFQMLQFLWGNFYQIW